MWSRIFLTLSIVHQRIILPLHSKNNNAPIISLSTEQNKKKNIASTICTRRGSTLGQGGAIAPPKHRPCPPNIFGCTSKSALLKPTGQFYCNSLGLL